MNIKAWAILTTGLADGYELTKSPARVQAARENGQTVVELVAKQPENSRGSFYGHLGYAKTTNEIRSDFEMNK